MEIRTMQIPYFYIKTQNKNVKQNNTKWELKLL